MMIEVKSDKERGDLVPIYPLEFGLNPIKRIMIFKNSPLNSIRGNHGHRREIQLFYIMRGEIEVEIETSGGKETKILRENDYLQVLPFTWTIFKFTKENTELIVFGSEEYDEDEYIRDHDEFLELIK